MARPASPTPERAATADRRGFGAVNAGLSRPSGKLLVAVNLGLLLAVIHFDWSVFDVIFLYWAENLVIGVINVLKMATANPDPFQGVKDRFGQPFQVDRRMRLMHTIGGWAMKLFLIPFFIVHYGGFCAGHGFFIFALFDGSTELGDDPWTAIPALFAGALGLSLAVLAISHLFSFFVNYLGGGEYRRTSPMELMMRPYGRIVALHVTIIIGGMAAMAFGNHVFMLVVLVVLKTFVDLAMHGRERKKYLDPEQDLAAA